MTHIATVGAGISDVITAYASSQLGYQATMLDRHLYSAMEISFVNGGQLFISNTEVRNSTGTLFGGIKWMLHNDTPLLFGPEPSWHEYSWIGEFVASIVYYRRNTIGTTRMAIEARKHLFVTTEREQIDPDPQKRDILHVYYGKASFVAAGKANALPVAGGLERHAVSPEEIAAIESTLRGNYYGGYFTASDAIDGIRKFTRGPTQACEKHDIRFMHDVDVHNVETIENGVRLLLRTMLDDRLSTTVVNAVRGLAADATVVCMGVDSRYIAQLVGDRINVYPVKGYLIAIRLGDDTSVQGAPQVGPLDESAKIVMSHLGAGRFHVASAAEFDGYNRDICVDRIEPLVAWTCRNFVTGILHVVSWAGLRSMMPDMVSRVDRGWYVRVFYNTGHRHLGRALSGVTAVMVGDVIM